MNNNTKQLMSEGIEFEEAMGFITPSPEASDGMIAEFERLYTPDLPLPVDRKVICRNKGSIIEYTVNKVISNEGSCGIIYLMSTAEDGRFVVMKEFCPKSDGVYRLSNGIVDDYDSMRDGIHNYQLVYDGGDEEIKNVERKFKAERKRIEGLVDMNQPEVDQKFKEMNLARPLTPCFEYKGNLYYALSYESGDSLFDFVYKGETELDWKDICKVMKQLCNALSYLHRNCIHQDVSPSNILMDGNLNLTLIDFGLATDIHHEPGMDSFHNKGTKVFTDTTSRETEYKMLLGRGEEGKPKPILVLDIYSVGMIFFFLWKAADYKGKSKEDLRNELPEDLLKLLDMEISLQNITTTEGLVDALQRRAIIKLILDSTSFDENRKSPRYYDVDSYGPFHRRPKDTAEWMARLQHIDSGIESSVKGMQPDEITVSYEGQAVKLPVVEDGCSIVYIPEQGTATGWYEALSDGNPNIQIVENNRNDDRRLKVYVVRDVEVVARYCIVQKGKPVPSLVLSSADRIELPANEPDKAVEIVFETNGAYKVEKSQWLTVKEGKEVAGKHTLYVTATSNVALESREGFVKLSLDMDGTSVVQEITCIQPGCGIVLATSDALTFGNGRETKDIVFKTGSDYSIDTDGMKTWITLGQVTENEDGWLVLPVTALPNSEPHMRDTKLAIVCSGNRKEISFFQAEKAERKAFLKVDIIRLMAEARKKDYDIPVSASGEWRAYFEKQEDWVFILKGRGCEDGKVGITVKKNPSLMNRDEVKMVVELVDDPKVKDTVRIVQQGMPLKSVDWKKIWEDCKPYVWGLVIGLALVVGYFMWQHSRPGLVPLDDLILTAAKDDTGFGWSFKAKDDWTAELVEGDGWLMLEQEKGTAGKQVLKGTFKPNNLFKDREAVIRLTCSGQTEKLVVKQAYNRADSLNQELSAFLKLWKVDRKLAKEKQTEILDRLQNQNRNIEGVFRLKDGSPVGNNARILTGEAGYRIGVTHRVTDFTKDSDGIFTRIILEPIDLKVYNGQ